MLARAVVPAVLLAAGALAGCAGGDEGPLVLGTTTTTQDSGLLDALLPAFERASGLRVKAVVGGTGEIHEKGKRGDVDVLLTHSPERERALVADGWALERRPVAFSLFAVAGPADDPAGARRATDAPDALARIRANASPFASRGDQSGTHEKELALWRAAGLDPTGFDRAWYKETGAGQAQTLLYAAERGAYLLVDWGTLLQLHAAGKAAAIVDLHHDDPTLRNQYAVTLLDPARAPGVRAGEARALADWLSGPEGQAAFASFAIAGERPFTPNAGDPAA